MCRCCLIHLKNSSTCQRLLIRAIHNVDRPRLPGQQIEDVDVVEPAIRDMNEAWNGPTQIEQGGHLHRCLGGAERCPRKHRQTQVDSRRVQGIDGVGQFQSQAFVGVIPLSPETEVYVAGTYAHPISDSLELVTRVDYSYQSKRYVRTINYAHTGSEALLGAQVSLVGLNWSVMAWGRNLTDEDSATSALRYFEANSFFFGGRSFAATPRPGAEYGLTFRYNY
jgi:hypothetical protein